MTLLAGLDTPTSGSISLLDKPISEMNDEERALIRSESVGFVFQSFLLVPSLSALDNVTLPCLLKGEPEDRERAQQLLASVGLEHRMRHFPTQLSGGEQQRVALARAFMIQPKVLFADEPKAEKVIQLLFELNKQHGTTLVLVTHDMQLADLCDRRLHIQAGRLEEC